MDYGEKLNLLLRERELAVRIARHPFREGSAEGAGFWRRLLSGRRRREVHAAKERWEEAIIYLGYRSQERRADQYPPAQPSADRLLLARNRTIDEIEADIAAIPPVTVTRRDFLPTYLPAMRCTALVLAGVMKTDAGSGIFRDLSAAQQPDEQITQTYHPAIRRGLADALGAVAAHPKTRLGISKDTGPFPDRSRERICEYQNYDSHVRSEVDGRHLILHLHLSKPMHAAVLACLNEPDTYTLPFAPTKVFYKRETTHVVYAPIDLDDTPRDLPYGDKTPFVRQPFRRLTQIHIAELSSCDETAELVNVIRLTESP
jgi:hypothetical protein